MAAIIRRNYTWKSFNVKPVSGFDNAQGLSDMAEAGQPIFLPPETFEVWSAANWGHRGAHIIGTSQYGNTRPASDADIEASILTDKPTRIKYVGSSGANTACVKIAKQAVGVPITSTDVETGDDLFDVKISGILFDANNLADFALYCYRAGNGAVLSELSGIRSKEYGLFFAGMFTCHLQHLRALRNKKVGVAIGHNPFNDTGSVTYSQFEWTANSLRADDIHAFDNGLDKTWDESTNPFEGAIILSPGRNCRFTTISCEGNDNPMVVMPTRRATYPASGDYFRSTAQNLCFNNRIASVYLENNGADVVSETRSARAYGLIIKNDYYGGGLTIEDVYQHPGSSLPEQHIKVVSVDVDPADETAVVDNQGSTDYARQLVFTRVGPGGDIYSNTTRFRVDYVDSTITFPDETPNTPSGGTLSETSINDAITMTNSNASPTTQATGRSLVGKKIGHMVSVGLGGAALTNCDQATFGSGSTSNDNLSLTGFSGTFNQTVRFPINVVAGPAISQIWGRCVSGTSVIDLYQDASGNARFTAANLHATTDLFIEFTLPCTVT